jgi:hypothetical protein
MLAISARQMTTARPRVVTNRRRIDRASLTSWISLKTTMTARTPRLTSQSSRSDAKAIRPAELDAKIRSTEESIASKTGMVTRSRRPGASVSVQTSWRPSAPSKPSPSKASGMSETSTRKAIAAA